MTSNVAAEHPAHGDSFANGSQIPSKSKSLPPLLFAKLQHVEFERISAVASDIRAFVQDHLHTVSELNLEDVDLRDGTWDDALAPLTKYAISRPSEDVIPIMLSPSTLPTPMERVEVAPQEAQGRPSLRLSRWLSAKGKTRSQGTAGKGRGGLLGCSEELRKKLRGSVLPWR